MSEPSSDNSMQPVPIFETGETTKTTCPYCGVGCGVLVTPQDDGSVEVKGDPDHPANFGRLCSKGSALGQTIDLEGRLLEPEINGQKADWDSALNLVAEKFKETIETHGPDAVAFYVSGQILTEDYYIANKLMKGFIGSANIDTNSRLCMASSVAGHRKAFGTDTVPGLYADLELADLIILVGSNLAWCHPVLYQRIEATKQANPNLKVVLVDPRRTMTAQLCDMHLPIKSDGDVALFQGLLVYLAKHENLDDHYISQFTNGFDDALSAAQQIDDRELEQQTGLSKEELEAFYALFAETEKTVTCYSQGVNQSNCGTDKVSAIINCHLATGRIGQEGMGPFSLTGQPNAMGGREVGGLANMLAAHMNIEDEAHRDIVQRFWKSPTISPKAGLKAVDMFKAVKSGDVKAIWIMATNPADSMPDADGVSEALKNCPFVVVSDVLNKTDTIEYAHVKLPSLGWGEKDGTVTNSERRISHQKKFLKAPHLAKPDWWQMNEVAKRMGYETGFDYNSAYEIFKEHAELSAFENDGDRDFDIGEMSKLTSDEYEALEPFNWPKAVNEKNCETRFFANGNFYTKERKANFTTPATKSPAEIETSDKLLLNTGRVRDHWHTMTRTGKSERLSGHIGEPYCEIHSEDAASLSINEAQLVKVSSEFGEIIVRALITDRVQKNSVFVPIHWTNQTASNARPGKLLSSSTDPFSGQPALKMGQVSIDPFMAKQYGFMVCRDKPETINAAYWAIAKCEGGWRVEFAFSDEQTYASEVFANILPKEHSEPTISFADKASGRSRYAWFDGEKLAAAIYLADEPVEVSRVWAASNLQAKFDDSAQRHLVIASKASGDLPDRGAIICSCFGVGANEIASCVKAGSVTVQQIGKVLNAGTNCGSCKSEIAGIINENRLLAAE